MSPYGDYFKGINFDKSWEEEDWERFFDAQDRMVRDAERRSSPSKSSSRPNPLSFREVLRRFGMDPDRPAAENIPADVIRDARESGILSELTAPDLKKDGLEVESLPVYGQSALFARSVMRICESRFGRLLHKIYRSKSYQLMQELLEGLQRDAVKIPGVVAAGHSLGYDSGSVKGNIVRCRKALVLADDCLGRLSRLPAKRFRTGEYRRLFQENLRLRNGLRDWITYLRHRARQPER